MTKPTQQDRERAEQIAIRHTAYVPLVDAIASALAAERERCSDAKRRALAIADERSKENVELRAENKRLRGNENRQ